MNQIAMKKNISRLLSNYLVLIAILFLVIATIIVEPKFLSAANLTNIIRQFGPLSLVSLGMTFVIVGGFIDLSVAGMLSLIAVITISLIDKIGQGPAFLAGLAFGLLFGLLNSLVLLTCGAMTQAEALFITFGMSTVYGALALILSGGSTQHMKRLVSSTTLFKTIGQGGFGFISVSFLIFLFCLVILHILHKMTYLGRSISMTGGNKTAASLAGIPVKRSVISIFAISGLMTALGAIVLFSRVTTVSPVIGKGFETTAILAVVVGGTTLKGGKGSVLRTVLGVLLVTLLSNCMNLLGVSPYMQSVMQGAILIVAIWLDNRKEL